MRLPRTARKPIVAMALPKMGEKKRKKRIVATKLPKMEEKKCYVYNIFHNKLQVISYYWFKFESNTKITFLSQ